MTLRSETARRFLLAVISVLFVLCLIEFLALTNMFDYRGLIGPLHLWWAPNISDPELLHIHRPYAHQRGEIRGGLITWGYQIPPSDMTLYRWDVTYDHNGFRNEVDLKKAEMIVIGDSFVEGLTVPTAQLTTSLLEQLQSKVVANLGQSAYGPQQELVVLKRYGLPLQPHTVIWMFFEGNDLEDVITYRNAIHSPLNFWRGFYQRSFTRNALKEVKRRLFAAPRPSGVRLAGVIDTPDGKKVKEYFAYNCPSLSGENIGALDETLQTIATAHNICAAKGAQFIFVFVPTKFRVFRDFCQFPQESECRNWVVNDLPERLEKGVRSVSAEIGYLDLTPFLMQAVKEGEFPYYQDDDHWTPEGHKVAAQAINNYLLSTHNR
jgi:hypothetical protein